MRRLALVLAAAAVGVGGIAVAQSSPLSYSGSDLTCTNAVAGDGWIALAAKVGAPSGLALANQEGGNLDSNIRVGQRVCWAPSPDVPPPSTTEPPVVTVPETTKPEPTVPTTTAPTESPVWSNVSIGTNREATITIPASIYPDLSGVTFYRNGVLNRTDATGPEDGSTFHFYPGITIAAADVLRATWTDRSGAARESVHPASTSPPPTTAPPATTEPPTSGPQFVETFDGNSGLDRFDFGVYHRDDSLVAQTEWSADHDLSCGDPSTQRTVRRDTDEWIYVCRDHLMTAIGDTSGYSTAYFEPRQTFTGSTSVSWDVNVTDLMDRQWWEVAIVPASFDSGAATCPHCSVAGWLSGTAHLPAYPDGSVVVGNGPVGGDLHIRTDGAEVVNPFGMSPICAAGNPFVLDPQGCASKLLRRTFTVTDNGDGTVSVDAFGRQYTAAGRFPTEFRVVLKDHNYTPNKDGDPVGYTWHWDNIAIS